MGVRSTGLMYEVRVAEKSVDVRPQANSKLTLYIWDAAARACPYWVSAARLLCNGCVLARRASCEVAGTAVRMSICQPAQIYPVGTPNAGVLALGGVFGESCFHSDFWKVS